MMAAVAAAESGQEVHIFEKNEKLGRRSTSREKGAAT